MVPTSKHMHPTNTQKILEGPATIFSYPNRNTKNKLFSWPKAKHTSFLCILNEVLMTEKIVNPFNDPLHLDEDEIDQVYPAPQLSYEDDALAYLDDEELFTEHPKEAVEREADDTWRTWQLKQTRILALSSIPTLLQPLSITIFLPALEDVQHSLNTTETLVTLTATLFNLFNAFGSFTYGPLSDYYGRKRILLFTMPVFCKSLLLHS